MYSYQGKIFPQARAGVPNLSLTMYPYSSSAGELVPLKFLMTIRLGKITKIHWILIELQVDSILCLKVNWLRLYNKCTQRHNGGTRGAQFPGRRVWVKKGGQITAGSAEKSQQCHKYFLPYSTFASERPQFQTWGRKTCFLSQAPSNLVTPLNVPPEISKCTSDWELRG